MSVHLILTWIGYKKVMAMVVMKLKDNIIHLCVQRDDEDDGEDKVQRDHPGLEIKDHHGDGQDK